MDFIAVTSPQSGPRGATRDSRRAWDISAGRRDGGPGRNAGGNSRGSRLVPGTPEFERIAVACLARLSERVNEIRQRMREAAH